MFLELAYLPLKLRFANICFKKYQISAGQPSADSSSTETLYCVNRCTGESGLNGSLNYSIHFFIKYRKIPPFLGYH